MWRELGDLLGCAVNLIGEEPPDDRFMRSALKDALPL